MIVSWQNLIITTWYEANPSHSREFDMPSKWHASQFPFIFSLLTRHFSRTLWQYSPRHHWTNVQGRSIWLAVGPVRETLGKLWRVKKLTGAIYRLTVENYFSNFHISLSKTTKYMLTVRYKYSTCILGIQLQNFMKDTQFTKF